VKLLRRLRGLVFSANSIDEARTAGTQTSSRRKRDGGRNGRGRRRGEDNAYPGQKSDTQQYGGTPTPVAKHTQIKSERTTQRDGRRRTDTRSRNARRSSLDAPLPEDIAFRPTTEGGDGSILPGRRRPPPGARTTNRVLVTGKRNLPVFPETFDEALTQPETSDIPDEARPVNTMKSEETNSDSEPRRNSRRRGRRGGRGRGSQSPNDRADKEVSTSSRKPQTSIAPESGPAPSEFPQAFVDLGISERSLTAIAHMGFSKPTPVQERAIPVLLTGRDTVGIAQTGTGKTLAFGIPMVESIDTSRDTVQGLVLVPTRELAQQVLSVLVDLANPFEIGAIGLLGGHALEGDFRALEKGPQIVVGTPGRIKDHLRRGTLSLRNVRLAILDEADQMLDIGFLPDITHILGRTPRSRKTALFSATMPHTVMRLIRRYMEDPVTIAVASDLETVDSIEHVYYEVAQRDKVKGLRELIERELRGRTLVFLRTKRGVDHIADLLQGLGVRVGALHGDLDQRRRDRMISRFRDGELDILIATNVAARGIDIPEITHVVNYDVPDNPEEYIHRTGRTGRAGRAGKAISFVSEVDVDRFDMLREAFGDRLRQERLELYV
jgi:ATP-dependent RNA helicase DeaD